MKHFTFTLLLAAALAGPLTASAATEGNKKLYISTSNARLNVPQTAGQTLDITLFRSLYAGYNTLCLPFDMTADEVKETFGDVKLERLSACRQNGAALELYFTDCTDEGIEAGQPYLIYSPVNKSAWVKLTDVRTATNEPAAVTVSDAHGNRVTFRGVFEKTSPVGRYGIPAAQALEGEVKSILVRTDGTKHFLPTRCGIEWDAQTNGATELVIKHMAASADLGSTTGIDAVQAQDGAVDVYALNGVLVKSQVSVSELSRTLPKGIYVINGEKYLVK